ncbi:aldehyde dehydrogenase family protein, partial [Brucella melitensis]
MLALKDPSLLKSQCLVNGRWIDAADGTTIKVTNPADGSVIGTVPSLSVATIKEAIDASAKALSGWAAKTAKERAGILRKWFDLIIANADDIALIMTSEQGKPLAEARGEVLYAASFIEWFAEEAKRVYGDTIPAPQNGQRLTV